MLFFKQQGKLTADVGTSNGLKQDDFALVIQTPLQAEMLRCCGDKKIVCLDATHGTNSYDFMLISVLVVDEYGEGFPASWCIANHENKVMLMNFFSHLKLHVGNIHPQWLKTDDAEQYYSAWVATFEGVPTKLLCNWHVDRSWRRALANFVSGQEEQVHLYHILRVLIEEMDREQFLKLLKKAIFQMKEDTKTKRFADYFTQTYASRYQQWAFCFRKLAGINTNMYVESFHRTLKYVYMKGHVNKRLDSMIYMLMKYARDKTFDRIMKVEKGKRTKRTRTIYERHKKSLDLPSTNVCETGKNSWEVKSNSSLNLVYSVIKENETCPHNCSIKCEECSICVHNYSCTCADSMQRGTICKHIHLVQRYVGTKVAPRTSKPNTAILLRSVQNISKSHSSTNVKDRVLLKLHHIAMYIHGSSDIDSILNIEKTYLCIVLNCAKQGQIEHLLVSFYKGKTFILPKEGAHPRCTWESPPQKKGVKLHLH